MVRSALVLAIVLVLVLAIVLVGSARVAAADPQPLEPVPLAGPIATLDDVCAALKSPYADQPGTYTCTMLEHLATTALIALQIEVPPVRGRASDRAYALVVRDATGWERAATPTILDLTGAAWGSGNCCSGEAGPPRWDLRALHIDGFDGLVAVVQVELPTWRSTKPSWRQPGAATVFPHVHRSFIQLCGVKHGETAVSCYAADGARCLDPIAPTYAFRGGALEVLCDAHVEATYTVP